MFSTKAFEAELTRITIFWTAVEIVAAIIFFWVLYLVIKAAVRDGVNESRLGARWTRTVAESRARADDLPPMKAER